MITVPVSRRTSRLLSPVDVLVWVALGCFGVVKGTPAQAQTASVIIPDQYVVVLHDDADARAHADAAVREHGVQLLHIYEHAFKGFAFRGSAAAAEALSRNPNVEFVSPDQVVRLIDPLVRAEEVQVAAQTLPTGIDRIDADLNPISHIDGIDDRVSVNVAIVDTGIDPAHPDLNVVGGTNCLGGSSFADDNGHGSHVAGTVAAIDNAIGVVGVAPGANLYAVKVLDANGSGSFSSVACGIDFVTKTRTDRHRGDKHEPGRSGLRRRQLRQDKPGRHAQGGLWRRGQRRRQRRGSRQ